MKLNENHKYQNGYYHMVQLEGGSATWIYLVIEQSKAYPQFRNYIKSFTTQEEARECIDKLVRIDNMDCTCNKYSSYGRCVIHPGKFNKEQYEKDKGEKNDDK